jgi:hypothetical protein
MASNQLRLWLSTFAYLLLERLRTLALPNTVLERATAGTIRLRLLKIGALITVSVRRVYVRLASGFALKELFEQAQRVLRALPQGGGVAPHSFARTDQPHSITAPGSGGRSMPANGERRRQLRSWHRPKALDGAAAAVHGIKASSMTISTALSPISSHGV